MYSGVNLEMAEAKLLDNLRSSAEALLASKRVPDEKNRGDLLATLPAILMELKGVSEALITQRAPGNEAVESAKRRLAEVDDELRALKYQRSRLQRSIAECAEPPASTGVAATEAVLSDVISFEEAVRARPPAVVADSAHQQMLYRLGVERDERVRLHELRDGLVARKAALASTATSASELKAAVDAQMETVTAAAAALQAELRPPTSSGTGGSVCERVCGPLAPLLPSPLYTLALTAAAYLQAVEADATLSVTGDVEAAKALAKADGDGLAPHPLQVLISARNGAATLTVQYYGGLQLLAASATPPKADAALRRLHAQLPAEPSAAGAPVAAGAPAPVDDGSQFPDLRSSLRWHKLAADDGRAAADAVGVASLLPARPYQWLQWLGGLGPLLTATPQPSQLVLEQVLKVL